MKISFSQIKKYVDGKSFERGQKYYLQNRISFGKYGVDYIEGLCEGSYENYYHVRVYFSKNKIDKSDCSCPIGTGRCKHVVTLLLSWKNKKQIFNEAIDLKNLLKKASKTQIIELCLSITKNNIELKNYVETYLMNISDTVKEFSTEDYRKRISQSIKSGYLDFNSTKIILVNMELSIKLSEELIRDRKFLNSINLLNDLFCIYNQSGEWRKETLRSLKLQLQEDIFEPKLFLQEALKNNNYYLYSRKLIELGEIEKVENFIDKMEKLGTNFFIYDLIRILDTLIENDYIEIAEKIAYARMSGNNVQLLYWLKTHYETINELTQEEVNILYTVEKCIFNERPNEENYFNLKKIYG